MDANVRDALVTDYQKLVALLVLPDAGDRHVLAAAVVGHCNVIVTKNLKHFPKNALAPFGIEAQHPDDFMVHYLNLAPGTFYASIKKVRARLKNPPMDIADYLDILRRQGLTATVERLEPFSADL